ncbi:MAG: acyltransferase [Gammaproteobacteria bacterium]|nr:acyltransferase [Gammaproteobacteria bacterium]
MNNWTFRENSLDFIRLLAALQVAVLHSAEFMFAEKTGTLFFEILRLFPGVPIFFFISGYLISKSYEVSPTLSVYTRNRTLRIFPALIVVVFINILMVWSTGYFSESGATFKDITLLFFAKISFLQFYNPDFMRAFGDGVLNGSLWTICVELQFYILTPILYLVFGKDRHLKNLTLIVLIIIFMVLNRLLYNLADEHSNEVWWKLFRVSFLPWFYMFLTGVFIQRNFKVISKYVAKIPFFPLLLLYIFIAYFIFNAGTGFGNSISPLIFFSVVLIVFRMAYFKPSIFGKFLKGNDISYGIYIWHMVIVNQFLYYGMHDEYWHFFVAITLTLLLAITSWFLIENPSLGFKKFTIKK